MSSFIPGGSGFILSTNKVAALLELAWMLGNREADISTEEEPVNNITTTIDIEATTATIAATLPITPAVNNQGSIVVTAQDYLNQPLNLGADSDLKASSFPGAFLEIAQLVATAEQQIPTPPNNVTIAFDLEGGTATVAAAVPIYVTKDQIGQIHVTAVDYLPNVQA